MSDTYVSLSLSGATFSDGSTLSGTWTAEYDDSGNLIDIINPDLVVTSADGTTTTSFTSNNGTTGGNGAYQFFSQGNGGGFYNLYLDWTGESPTTLSSGNANYTSIVDPGGQTATLVSNGTVTNVTTAVTSTIHNAVFADGSTLVGTWTAVYDQSGALVGVENASFVVTGPQGSTTFTQAGTLPYADSASSSSFEIHFLSSTDNGGGYESLYVDWKSENPSSLYEGTPSLYTSVVSTSSGSDTPIRLIGDGTTGQGTVPVIVGLSATTSGTDSSALTPFSGVTISDDGATTVSATVTLNGDNGATDDNGYLTGTGVTRVGTGTYQISADSPTDLTEDLRSVTFTPTEGQTSAGDQVDTQIALAINDSDGSTSGTIDATITATCFLPGTLIATPDGERPIETLRAGDCVTVLVGSLEETRLIAWAGSGRMSNAANDHGHDGFPVRIRAGAFGESLPRRDLLVTAEHCLFVDGGLIPARMLVNGASILVDHSIADFQFHHIELDQHAILLAEGLPAESYLDTGNRDLFAASSGGPDHSLAIPAAPLHVSRDRVEPVWRRLRDRAAASGLPVPAEPCPVAGDPDLRVMLDDGQAVSVCALQHDRYLFRIPRDRRPVRLLSTSAAPSQVIGPFVDDRRRLGVSIDSIAVRHGDEVRAMPLSGFTFAGWHALEQDRRWTNGNAELVVPAAATDTILDIRVVDVMARVA